MKVSAPECPLAVAYPTLSEGCHPHAIDKQTVTEAEVPRRGSTDVLVLADGGKGGIVLDPAQHVLPTMQESAANAMEDALS